MSLILEALKKSEAKRRLGEAPDLGTPFAGQRQRGSLLPFIVAAIVIAGGVGWWLMRTPEPAPQAAPASIQLQTPKPATAAVPPPVPKPSHPTPTPMPQSPALHGPPVVVEAGRMANAARSAPVAASARERAMAASHVPQPTGPVTPRTPAVAAPTPVQPPVPVLPAPIAAATNPAAPAPNPTLAETKPAKADDSTPLKKAPKTASTIGLTPPTPPVPVAANAGSTPAPAAAPASAASEMTYADLPFSVRKALPALALSMHVYATDPAQRFVIFNDSRMVEGDKTQDDVSLREIRPDGVVLEFQGQRFFYPREGF